MAAVEHVLTFLRGRGQTFEVIVVSDGSTDGTDRALAPLAAREPALVVVTLAQNTGKGAAVRAGVLRARGARILFSDADLSTPIEELVALDAALDAGAQVACGSRRMPASRLDPPPRLLRRLAGATFAALVRLATGLALRDSQCGFKLFTRDAAWRLFPPLVERRFAFDVELLCRARQQGLRVVEVPVTWHASQSSRVRLVRDTVEMIGALARMKARGQLCAIPRGTPHERT